MGAGKPGDIAYLTAHRAAATSALVNNIAPAHLERMGSLLGIADTKGAIYDALPDDGVAVINADDAFAPYFAERAHGRRLIRFGLENAAPTSRARGIALDADGSRFTLVTPAGEADDRAAAAGPPQRAATRSPPPRWRSAPARRSTTIAAGLARRASRSPAAWSRIACATARC